MFIECLNKHSHFQKTLAAIVNTMVLAYNMLIVNYC